MFTEHTYVASGDSALPGAVEWIQDLLLGEIGSALAVLAVAGMGFAMLQGRLSPRHGLRVVLGCFILFGATGIADGLAGLARRSSGPPLVATITPPPAPAAMPSPPSPNADPYAGASVPM